MTDKETLAQTIENIEKVFSQFRLACMHYCGILADEVCQAPEPIMKAAEDAEKANRETQRQRDMVLQAISRKRY
ncbi:hypothetical protein [Atopobium sp. oral taxon 199]|uniref:hypothetical protein n=1 Tax=Atopobium sp. oral taxon 199 TaxID=712156 RepID=UPI00034E2FA3|nr:hypothetical protein [Atopobium sp. oral taxon 199]EPD78768.1 hypothetical protein HMPREF1527_01105 [Atopobium sp. oral taxon 199 str. F0494]